MFPFTKIILQDSQDEYKTKATALNTIFVNTINNCMNYSIYDYQNLSNIVSFVQDSTDIYNSTNIQKNVVMLVGPSGSGKSTLLDYISGVEMIVQNDDKGLGIYPKDPNSAPSPVGNGSGSTTFLPNLYSPLNIDGFKDTTFVDCPGDFDTNGPLFEILNEYTKMKIGNASENLKILLVVSQSSLSSDGSYGLDFKQTVEKLKTLVGGIQDLTDNIFIVISHAHRNPHIMDQVTTALNNLLGHSDDDFKPILQSIITNKRYTCFCSPSEEAEDGSDYTPPTFPGTDLSRAALLKSIIALGYKDVKGSNRFKVSSSSNLEQKIDGYVDGSKLLIGAVSIVNKKVIDSINSYIDLVVNQRIQIDFNNFKDLLAKVTDINNTNDSKISLLDFANQLVSKINNCGNLPSINVDQMNEIFNCLTLYSQFSSNPLQIQPNTAWKSDIYISKLMESFSKDNDTLKTFDSCPNNNVLSYHGYNLQLSDVLKKITDSITDIHIVALNQLDIDCDFTHPFSLSIYSPIWNISSSQVVTINLTAKDNENTVGPTNGVVDSMGKPGLAGYGGGNFYGVGEQFINIGNLKIISNGGKGGKGGDGIRGQAAKAGQQISISTESIACGYGYVERARDEINNSSIDNVITSKYITDDINGWWFKGNPTPLSYILRSRSEGNKNKFDGPSVFDYINAHIDVTRTNYGSEGGRGGRGGEGGCPGQIVVMDLTHNSNISQTIVCQTEKGPQGDNGAQGPCGYLNYSHMTIIVCYSHNGGFINDGIASATIEVDNKSYEESTITTPSPNNTFNDQGLPEPTPTPNDIIFYQADFLSCILKLNSKLNQVDILLSKFIQNQLINNTGSLSIDEVIQKTLVLENNFSHKNNQDAILTYYEKLQKDILSIARTVTDVQVINTIKYIYQLLCTAIVRVRAYQDTCIVIDMKVFLDTILRNISTLQELNKVDTIKVYQNNYNNNIQSKMDEANSFITTLQNNVIQSENEIIDNVNTIMDKVQTLIDKDEKQIDEYKDQIKKLKNNLIAREIVSGISNICSGISFFIPQVGYIGKAVDVLGGIVIPNDPNVPIKGKAQQGIANLELYKYSVNKEIQVDKHKYIDDTLKTLEATQAIEAFMKTAQPGSTFTPPDVSNLSLSDRILRLQTKDESVDSQQATLLYLAFQQNQPDPDQTLIQQLKDKAADLQKKFGALTQIQVDKGIQLAKNVNSMVKDYQVTTNKIQTLQDAIEANEEEIKEYQLDMQSLDEFKTQQFGQITNYISNFEDSLDNQSSASLDMSQFQMDTYIQKLQSVVSKFPAQDSSCSLANTVQLLSQSIDQVLKIYQRIQAYQDQSDLANYIADVTSNDPLHDIPVQYHDNVETMVKLITRNMVMQQYETALTTFSQWAFPFNSYYLGTDSTLVGPNSNFVDQSSMVVQIQQSVLSLQNIIDLSSSTISQNPNSASPDKNFMTVDFGTNNSQYPPFFVWNYCDYPNEINALLSGQAITLIADVNLSMYDVVKFNAINLTCQIPDDGSANGMNSQIQTLLAKFNVVLTHSGVSDFKFNNNIYRIHSTASGLQLTFSYNNTPDSSDSYEKLKNTKPILSPYTTWTIQLKSINPSQSSSLFTLLSKFNNVNVQLYGHGRYFDHNPNESPFPIESDYFYSQVNNSIIQNNSNNNYNNTIQKVSSKKILGKLKSKTNLETQPGVKVIQPTPVVPSTTTPPKVETNVKPQPTVVPNPVVVKPETKTPTKEVTGSNKVIPKKSISNIVSLYENLTRESKESSPSKSIAPKRSLNQLP